MKLKKGDAIKVLSGKDRAKTAKILHVYGKTGMIFAEGINLKKKHVRPKTQGKRGEIVEIPAPFPASIVMFICPSCSRPTRLGAKIEGGVKTRICKKCGAAV